MIDQTIQSVDDILRDTFCNVEFEFQDLDGLAWSTKPTPPSAEPRSSRPEYPVYQEDPGSHLEPLFSREEHTIFTLSPGSNWVNLPPSPGHCLYSPGRPGRHSHSRKLSRSQRVAEFSFTLPEDGVVDPFISTPSVQETLYSQEREWFEKQYVRGRLPAFELLELPQEHAGGDEGRESSAVTVGPPPGLPSPRPSFQPVENSVSSSIPF